MAANADTPMGARPIRYLGGRPYNGGVTEYIAESASAIFQGDFVKLGGGGASVESVDAGDTILGCMMGAQYTLTDGSYVYSNWKPSATAGVVYIADDPDLIYLIQAAGALSTANLGGNVDLVVGAGNTTTGRSAMEIANASATSSTRQLRIVDWHRVDDNDPTTANALWEVVVNEHHFKTTVGID